MTLLLGIGGGFAVGFAIALAAAVYVVRHQRPVFDSRRLTAAEPPIFALHNVRLMADKDSFWISSRNGDPLPPWRASITHSLIWGGVATGALTFGADPINPRLMLDFGTPERLAKSDAHVKVLVEA